LLSCYKEVFLIDGLLNLLSDRWIPIIRKDGSRDVIAPHEIGEGDELFQIMTLDAPRPDFNGALIQFLIGLYQIALMPDGNRTWRQVLHDPPCAESIRTSFQKYGGAFSLAGDEHRFMQDISVPMVDPHGIDSLLIEMPGENTVKKNTDFFLKRGTVKQMCPVCAAMALYTLQLNGPPGGAGHRTGLRGSGPLTSVILGRDLFETIWLNVLDKETFFTHSSGEQKNSVPDIFPWMGPVRTSENKQTTGPMDVSRFQMFWGMGRRILLDLDSLSSGICDLCGSFSNQLIVKYYQATYGPFYDENWEYSMTPYYKNKDVWFPRHCQPGGIMYRNWLGLVQTNPREENQKVALTVSRFRSSWKGIRDIVSKHPLLWSFGYDMDNMKARCWYESKMPLYYIDDALRDAFEMHVAQVVQTAEYLVSVLTSSVKKALYSSEKTKGNAPQEVRMRFWYDSEGSFYVLLSDIEQCLLAGDDPVSVKTEWLHHVIRLCLDIFDYYSQLYFIEVCDPKRIVSSRREFVMYTASGTKKMAEILGLPLKKREKKLETFA